jgi:hypothetical protein
MYVEVPQFIRARIPLRQRTPDKSALAVSGHFGGRGKPKYMQ